MKISVGVFFGGKSTEHEISCISANQVLNALDSDKYEVIPVYISKDNEFYLGDALFDIGNYSSIVKNPSSLLAKACLYKDANKVIVKPVKGSLFKKEERTIDVAFPVVHGTNVEDGSLAGYLQMLDLPYTSCDVLGGALGQDKDVMKDVFRSKGLPIVDYMTVFGSDFDERLEDYLIDARRIGFPLIAKPANLGSSIGIEIIENEDEFADKVAECLKYDFKVVVEKMIADLMEVNIAVMGNDDEIMISAIEEVTNGFLDYDKKYCGGGKGSKGTKKVPAKGASKGMASTNRKVPADLKDEQRQLIEETAKEAYRYLNAYGCVRIDYMIDKKTDKVYINEINTIPGSLSFYLWEATGISFSKECDLLIRNALKRYGMKEKKTYAFDTNILDGYRRKS